MKILFIIYGSIEQISGGYLYDRKVISSLREKNDTVEILELKRTCYLIAPLASFSHKIRKLLRQKSTLDTDDRYDCIVIDELVHPSLPFILFERKKAPKALVTLVHHLRSVERIGAIAGWITRFYEKLLLNHSDLIIVNSKTTKNTVRNLLKKNIPINICRPGKDTLIPSEPIRNYCDSHEKQLKKSTPSGQVEILTVGNVIPRKGHRMLVDALISLKELNWHLTVAGDTTIDRRFASGLLRFIHRSRFGHRVTITGTVPDQELVRLYEKADIFVFPSEYEGYGIALAEALTSGIPYIALDSGAISEVVGEKKDNRNTFGPAISRRRGGLLVCREQPSALQRALHTLIESREIRHQMSREAEKLAQSLPSWKQTGECFYRAVHSRAHDTENREEKRSYRGIVDAHR